MRVVGSQGTEEDQWSHLMKSWEYSSLVCLLHSLPSFFYTPAHFTPDRKEDEMESAKEQPEKEQRADVPNVC